MLIEKVRVKNFRSYAEQTVELAPLTLIVGANDTGKSSLLDAIGYCALGVCRGTDAGGKGADVLTRLGEKSGGVEMHVRRNGAAPVPLVRKIGAGPTSAAGKEIAVTLGPEGQHLGVLLRPGGWLDLSAGAAGQILARLSEGPDLTDVLAPILADHLGEAQEIPRTVRALDALEAASREERKNVKAQLDAIRVGDPPTETAQALAEEVARIGGELVALAAGYPVKKKAAGAPVTSNTAVIRAELGRLEQTPAQQCPHCSNPLYIEDTSGGSILWAPAQREDRLTHLRGVLKSQGANEAQPSLLAVDPAEAEYREQEAELKRQKVDAERRLFMRSEYDRTDERRTELTRRVGRLDSLIALLGPKGEARQAIIKASAESETIIDRADAVREAAGWTGKIGMDPATWTLSMGGVRSDLLSKSARWRLAVAIHAALASYGSRILVIDDTETLVDGDHRAELADAVERLIPGYLDQAIVAVASPKAPAGSVGNWLVLYVSRDDNGLSTVARA